MIIQVVTQLFYSWNVFILLPSYYQFIIELLTNYGHEIRIIELRSFCQWTWKIRYKKLNVS